MIKARLAGEPIGPFKYFDKGTMATIGYRSAVADAFGIKLTGFLGYLTWAFIHVAYLVGWGNRIGAMYTWARGIWFGHNRGHRIITFEESNRELNEPYMSSGRLVPILPMSMLRTTAPPSPAMAAAMADATSEADAPATDPGAGVGPAADSHPEGATEADAPPTDADRQDTR